MKLSKVAEYLTHTCMLNTMYNIISEIYGMIKAKEKLCTCSV